MVHQHFNMSRTIHNSAPLNIMSSFHEELKAIFTSTTHFYFILPMTQLSMFPFGSPHHAQRGACRELYCYKVKPTPQSCHLVLTQKVQQSMLSHKC